MAPERAPVASWSTVRAPVLVVGRGVPPGTVNTEACREAGIPVVPRRSGGGPVLWDAGLLGLDVVLPPGHPLADHDVTRAYRWLGEALAAALTGLGVPASAIPLADARAVQARTDPGSRLAARACFGAISPFEVVDPSGRKLVGLAQVRRAAGTVFQAGFALDFDAVRLGRLLTPDPAEAERLRTALEDRVAAIRAARTDLGTDRVIAATEEAFADRLGVTLTPGGLTAPETARQTALAHAASGAAVLSDAPRDDRPR